MTAELIISIVCATVASSGLWSFVLYLIQKKDKQKDALTRLMLGLAHEKIMELSAKYIEQGYMTEDEYSDFLKYFYTPYIELGGDGSAERIVENKVKKLDIKSIFFYVMITMVIKCKMYLTKKKNINYLEVLEK